MTRTTFKQRKFNAETIIKGLANHYGGAHYASKVPKYLSDLLSFGMNNQPALDNLILQVAELVFNLGVKLLKSITDIELYYTFYLSEKKIKEEVYLFDYKLPNNNNRLSLILNQGNLHLLIIDNIGYKNVLSLNRLIEYHKLQLINITIRTTPKFQTEIKIFIDENLIEELIIENPIFMINELSLYDCYYNRQIEKTEQNYEFGIGEIIAFGKIINHLDKIRLFKYFELKENNKVIWFTPNSFGFSKSGNKNIQMTGNVKLRELKDIE